MMKGTALAIAAGIGLAAVATLAVGWKIMLLLALIALCMGMIAAAELAREFRSYHDGQASRRAGGAKGEG